MIIFQKSNHAIAVVKMTIFGFIFTFISQGPFKLCSNTDQIQTTIADAKTTVATPAAAGLEMWHVSGKYFFFFCLVYSTTYYSPRQHIWQPPPSHHHNHHTDMSPTPTFTNMTRQPLWQPLSAAPHSPHVRYFRAYKAWPEWEVD